MSTDSTAGSAPSAPDTKTDDVATRAGGKSEKADAKSETADPDKAGIKAAKKALQAAKKAQQAAKKAEKAGEDANENGDKAAAIGSAAAESKTADPAGPDVETAPEPEAIIDPEPEVVFETEVAAVPETEVESAAKPAGNDAAEPAVAAAVTAQITTETAPAPDEASIVHGAAEPGVEPASVGDAVPVAAVAPSAAAAEAPAEETQSGAEETITQQIQQQPVPIKRQTGLPAVLTFVGNLIFGTLTMLEQILVGPPALPPNSTVTVQTSTLNVGGNKVQANWYFPDTDNPPDRLILLQHGFLATGPMYSYTAADLAERTGAVVVTPTFVSNILAGDGFWLGGDAVHRSVANLFIGDREDLTASAIAAGYAEQYGLSAAEAQLPQKFAITGHSLGGLFTAAVSGYLAENGGADDLVGAIMLDGVPFFDVMPDALGRLAEYQDETGRSVPIRHIAAPWNLWNSLGNANQWLNKMRPDTYNGVVLSGGVHMDSMRGGNEVIQFLAYLFAGFPTAANQAAVQELAVAWFDEWFTGAEVEGPELGSTITIPTPYGDAYGDVIGTPSVESEDVDSLVA